MISQSSPPLATMVEWSDLQRSPFCEVDISAYYPKTELLRRANLKLEAGFHCRVVLLVSTDSELSSSVTYALSSSILTFSFERSSMLFLIVVALWRFTLKFSP